MMKLLCGLGYATLFVSTIVMFFVLVSCVFILLHSLILLEFYWIIIFMCTSILSAFIMISLFALFEKLVDLQFDL